MGRHEPAGAHAHGSARGQDAARTACEDGRHVFRGRWAPTHQPTHANASGEEAAPEQNVTLALDDLCHAVDGFADAVHRLQVADSDVGILIVAEECAWEDHDASLTEQA